MLKRASESDLVFIGESHLEENRTVMYRSLLDQLVKNDSRFDCVFLEDEAKSEQSGLGLEKCNNDRSLLKTELFESNEETACHTPSTSGGPLQNEAYKLGLKVFAIDNYEECAKTATSVSDLDNCRDQSMQTNIQNLINAGKCHKALSVNGAPHITSIIPGHKPLGQRAFLIARRKPLRIFRINFMYSTRDPRTDFDPRWRWRDWHEAVKEHASIQYICESNVQPIAENYAVMTKDLKIRRQPYLWFYGRPVGNWADFDATIISR